MITTYRIAFSAATLLFFAYVARAQQTSQGSVSGGTVTSYAQAGQDRPQTAIVRMPAPPAHGTAITGAPFSAEEVSDHTQTLADGTHVTQKTQITKRYRDSEGRTRYERPMFMGTNTTFEDVIVVEINDPVSGYRYVLDTYNRVAHRFSPPEKANEPARYTQEARPVPQATAPVPVRQAPAAAPPRTTGPEVSSESLGTQMIEGVSAEGKRMTRTFPIGAVGNDRPIVNSSESWFSPELKMTVLSKYNDPRSGEQVTRMQNINRSEPDPALFRAPADYQLVDESGDRVEIKIVRP